MRPLLIASLFLFSLNTLSFAQVDLKRQSVRTLITRLTNEYIQIGNSLKELEESTESFPSTTVSLSVVKPEKGIRLVSMDVMDNKMLLYGHIYTSTENEALDAGGRHQLYLGEISEGEHNLNIVYHWVEEDTLIRRGEEAITLPVTTGRRYFLFLELSREDAVGKARLKNSLIDMGRR